MQQVFFEIEVPTPGKSLNDINILIQFEVEKRGFASGLLTLWGTHTGASLLVQANSDDDVVADILAFVEHLVPTQAGRYRHKPDDLDNAPSHIRALLTQTQVSLPVEEGTLPLGKVQSLFLFEHREAPKTRRLRCHFMGTQIPHQ